MLIAAMIVPTLDNLCSITLLYFATPTTVFLQSTEDNLTELSIDQLKLDEILDIRDCKR